MSIERVVRLVAGTVILTSVFLSRYHSRYWLLVTLFVGANLFQSAITRWCLLEDILRWAGFRSCCETSTSRPAGNME